MAAFSSSSKNTVTSNQGRNFCDCGNRLYESIGWIKKNLGRRFIGCPNFGKPRKCKVFWFIDDELPNQHYKDLLYEMHLEIMKLKSQSMCNRDVEDLKLLEELAMFKSKLKFYDRFFVGMVGILAVLCIVVAILALK